ncbi:metallophosphoesterase [Pseudomonas sp. SWRI92]|uniref:metallophosphoesterase n=1 Tax=Pseudomonas sp. SWRI92 TaxID=2745499 RepID=UPI0016459577|nr:metallophosphoesterase [Pseudomonas sp. SWRI92]MBC3374459.1 metallophosphoesterase [Pseudomonas sp. SWRI92]
MYRTASFPPNKQGRDFVVGDIHGHFNMLATALTAVNFNTELDRIFSVGDLIDRGPDSEDVLNWLEKPWFHAVRGNHEQMLIDGISGHGDRPRHIRNGGAWLYKLNPAIQDKLLKAFEKLPVILEIHLSPNETVGVVHAQAPMVGLNDDWQGAKDAITGKLGEQCQRQALAEALYAREKIERQDQTSIKGLHALYVGHSTVPNVTRLGNVVYMDTGCSFSDGALSLVEINSQAVISVGTTQ